MVAHEIPLIDISRFLDIHSSETERAEVVSQVRDACQTYGFFQLVGHGISTEMQDAILGCAKSFFDLSLEEKKTCGRENSLGLSNRGYEVIGGQKLQADALPDLKEVPKNSNLSSLQSIDKPS